MILVVLLLDFGLLVGCAGSPEAVKEDRRAAKSAPVLKADTPWVRMKSSPPMQQPVKYFPIFETEAPPIVDGDLSDPVWQQTTSITEFISCGGLQVDFRTEVRLSYDRSFLYISYLMEEPDMAKSSATVRRHDGEVWRDDRAEIFIWITEGPGSGYYQLMANMLGTTEDAKNLSAPAWNPAWDCAVKVDKAGGRWVMEARIAFAQFGLDVPAAGSSWKMNFGRERFSVPDHYSWARISGSFHQREAFNAVTFCGLPRNLPPSPVREFTANPGRYFGEVDLKWVGAGGKDRGGSPCRYDTRFSSGPIQTEEAFESASPLTGSLPPLVPGQAVELVAGGLLSGSTLYFAVRPVNSDGSMGPISSSGPVLVPGGELGADSLAIEPTLACAGILLRLGAGDATSIRAEYRKSGQDNWQEAHPFTRVDLNHAATSLFNLEEDSEYEIRISMPAGESLNRFRTRKRFTTPPPLRSIDVYDSEGLRRSLDGAQPGDEIRIHPGVYLGGFSIRRSGTEDHPILIRGVVPPGEETKPTWLRKGLPIMDGGGRAQSTFLLDGTPERLIRHVALSDLQIRNGREIGIHLRWAAWCTVQNCQVYDNGSYANVHINKGGPQGGRHLIRGNHIADLDHPQMGFASQEQKGVTYYGFKQDNHAGPGTVFCGNRVEGHSDGISSTGDESESANVAEFLPSVFSRWFNHSMDICDNDVFDHADDAIEADGIGINQRFFNNRIRKCQNAISIAPSMPGPFFFMRNTAVDFQESCVKFNTADGRGTIRNIHYYHNTFSRGGGSGGNSKGAVMTLWRGTPSEHIVFRNNIFTGNRALIDFQGLAHTPDMDYDIWFSTGGPSEFKRVRSVFLQDGLRWEDHGLFADPELGADLAPRSGSPVRGRGVFIPGVDAALSGDRPDIGAFEPK